MDCQNEDQAKPVLSFVNYSRKITLLSDELAGLEHDVKTVLFINILFAHVRCQKKYIPVDN